MASARQAGWSGETTMMSRKRRVTDVDQTIVVPTPPRKRNQTHLPTPETGHRIDKRPIKEITQPSLSTTLPTPETLPRIRRSPRHAKQPTSDIHENEASPSGHTTFVLSHAGSSRPESGARRRAGLTFAQQMASAQAGSSSSANSSRHGLGVGMGGSRSGGHRVDRIVPGRLAAPARIEDDNPFLVSTTSQSSPGRSTRHRPAAIQEEEEDAAASPRSSPRLRKQLQSPPTLITDPVHSAMGLLSPPQTQRANRIRNDPPPPSPRTASRLAEKRAKAARLAEMMDEDENPFLVKPGQKVVHRPGPIVDESRPTVTYVFRGAKKVFANPFFDPNVPVYGSNLNVNDEEYEAHPCPKPKLLWPTAPDHPTSTPRRRRGLELSDEEVSPPSSPMPMQTPAGHDEEHGFESDDEFLPEHEEPRPRPVRPIVKDQGEQEVRRGLLFGPKATIPTSASAATGRSRRRL